MNSNILFLFFLQATINVVNLAIAQTSSSGTQQVYSCRNLGDFGSESLRQQRDSLLDSLTSQLGGRYTGYIHTRSTKNKSGEQVHAIVMCPPGIEAEDCGRCVKKTIPYLVQNCKNQKEGVGWTTLSNYINCMVRYADSDVEAKYEFWGSGTFSSLDASAPPADLSAAVLNFGKELAGKIKSDALQKYASGKTIYGSDKRNIYMASQCTPDLSDENCKLCLNRVGSALENLTKLGKLRGTALSINCYSRYDHDPVSPTIYSSAPSLPYSGGSSPFGFATYASVYDDNNSDVEGD